MPILFLSDSGLHGELLYSLVSESLPFNWEKSEIGKQQHCLKNYEAIVVDGFPLTPKNTQSAVFNHLKSMDHPRIFLINFPPDLPHHIRQPLNDRKFLFLSDNRSNQKELLTRLGLAIQNASAAGGTAAGGRPMLTKREQEILAELTNGEANSVIAARLHLSEHTVKNHMYNIFRKIGVKNRLQASNWAKLHLQAERI
ncbi:helix-turn-helix transcriptional regulator [uncultured Microbulbifer sp.]|uniref:response regulator transcription factor n=1 Tax=uncultured Microbulbifer sp. TaxID=348147 RepID=UPI0025FAD8D2|nr:helix-turn-helix transcriptional regulator [uncultured Microbulbifer sp.]